MQSHRLGKYSCWYHPEIRQGEYFIPAGTNIVGNHWAIHRDEAYYGPNVEDFKIDRWLDKEGNKLKPDMKHFQWVVILFHYFHLAWLWTYRVQNLDSASEDESAQDNTSQIIQSTSILHFSYGHSISLKSKDRKLTHWHSQIPPIHILIVSKHALKLVLITWVALSM